MTSPTPGPLPLEGVKVADFSWIIAGPMLTKYLAIYGADVVKVEAHVTARPIPSATAVPAQAEPSEQPALRRPQPVEAKPGPELGFAGGG